MLMARVPQPQEVSNLLTQLVGRQVDAGSGGPLGTEVPGIAATYVADDGAVRAVFVVDVAAAASLGAALTMVPSGQVDEAVARGGLNGSLMENFKEVCNVMASLVSEAHGESFCLGGVHLLPGEADPIESILGGDNRLDLSLDVTGYPTGVASFIAA